MDLGKTRLWNYSGIGFGVLAICLNAIAHAYADQVEQWYSRGIYLWIRKGWELAFGWLPFPAFYLFWTGVLFYLIYLINKTRKVTGLFPRIKFLLLRIMAFTGVLIGSFFVMWGFNYARVPLAEQLSIHPEPLDATQLWSALQRETASVSQLRAQIAGSDTGALSGTTHWPPNAEDTVRSAVQHWLEAHGFPASSVVRGRMIRPKGLLFGFGASGIYWPWVGEGNLEAGMHPLRVLPAMAHEMSHAYGFGDEGVCNFIAYVALADHPNPYLAYVAHLDYCGDLARACRRQSPATFQQDFLPLVPAGVLADEEAIRLQHAQYQELAPALRYQVYDSYLKSQGIASGMLNYNEVIMLVEAWNRQDY